MKLRNRVALLAAVVVAAVLGIVPGWLAALPVMIGNTQTTAELNALMKITFDDTLISEVVTDTELLDIIPEGEVKRGPEGRWFESSQLYQNPGSIGSRLEGGYIPTPNGAKAENARITLKKIMGAIEETAEVLKKIRGDKSSFVNWAKEQFPAFKEDLSDEIDRQLLGDGSAIRARVNMAVPAATLKIDSSVGIAGFDNALMQFRRGMFLRAGPNPDGSGARAGFMTVIDVDWDEQALIVDAPVAALADDDFLWEGDNADSSIGKDMMGLIGLVDDGGVVETLQNIDRSQHRWFRSYVDSAATKPLNEARLLETDKVARFRGGGIVDLIVMSEDAFNVIWLDLKQDRTINDPRAYVAGRKGIKILFGGTREVELRTARKMPSKLIFGIEKNQLRKFIMNDWEWDDTTGSIWNQVVDSNGRKHAFYAYGAMFGEIGIRSPQRCWRVDAWANA